MPFRFRLLLVFALATGCSSTTTVTGTPAATSAADTTALADTTVAFDPTTFASGEFQLSVVSVDDTCLDGSLDLVFMPTGKAAPYPLKNRTLIPALSELPKTYAMKLAAPFSDMTITMVSVQGKPAHMAVQDAVQKNVALGLPGSKDCVGDLRISAEVAITSKDAVTLSVTATLDALRSATDTCPVAKLPCAVKLTMTGAR